MKKRMTAPVFLLLLIMGVLTISATAADSDFVIDSGTLTKYRGSDADVSIPFGVTTIDYSAFLECDSLISVVIPDSVHQIGALAFGECKNLCSVKMPSSITSLGMGAFAKCSSLYEITIPGSLNTITTGAFQGCAQMTNVVISDGVAWIGDIAFAECGSLRSVTIPDSITGIGVNAFRGCANLTDLYYSGTEAQWDSISFATSNEELLNDHVTIHYNYGKTIVAQGYCGDEGDGKNLTWSLDSDGTLSIIGNGRMKSPLNSSAIPWNSQKSKIEIVKFQGNVTSIGNFAFDDCSVLTSIAIPDSVTHIGYGAFEHCTNLASVTIGNSVTSIGRNAFLDCTNMRNVIIPDSVTSIGINAFYNCDSLTSITIPDSVTSIEDSAFSGCSELTSVTIGNNVASIGDSAFSHCRSLMSVAISSSVTSIGEHTFDSCKSLTSVTIPHSVISIGEYAFEDCESLTSVTIGNSVTSIGNGAFYKCASLTSVTIPDSVTNIGDSAFFGCSGLTEVIIGNGVTSLNGFAFSDYKQLKEVAIGSSVTSIKGGTFADCSSLTSVSIPDSVTSIGDSAFYNCSGLTSVTIPDSVASIGDSAFSYCTGLTSVTIPNNVTSIGESTFDYCIGLTSVTISDNVTFIGNSAFRNCWRLTSVTIPSKVTSIGAMAFAMDLGNSNLTSVAIPDSVTSIGEMAFKSCDNLTGIIIPNSVTFIGGGAFIFCIALTDITIPAGITSLEESTFFSCRNLTSVTIPNSVTSIKKATFGECQALTDVYYIGSEDQWKTISIGSSNSCLTSATIYYNSTLPDKPNEPDKPEEPKTSKGPITFLGNGLYRLGVGGAVEVVAAIPGTKASDFLGWGIADNDSVIRCSDSKVRELAGTLYVTAIIRGVSPGTRTVTVSTADGRSAACTITVSAPVDDSAKGFDADIYRANWLLSGNQIPQGIHERLGKETPSHQLCAAGEKNGLLTALNWWQTFKTISNGVDDATSVADFVFEPKDVYIAIILDTLEGALSEEGDIVEGGVDVFDNASDYVSNIKDLIESIQIADNNIEYLSNLDRLSDAQKQTLKEYSDGYFKSEFPKADKFLTGLGYAKVAIDFTGDVYKFTNKMLSLQKLASVGERMQTYLNALYQESLSSNDPYLKSALKDCTKVVNDAVSGMITEIAKGSLIVPKHIAKFLWSDFIQVTLYASHPAVLVLQTAYKLSSSFSNYLFHTDDTRDAFLKMQSVCAIETVADRFYRKAMNQFSVSKTSENASLYLTALDFSFALKEQDCRCAYEYVDALDGAHTNDIWKVLGFDTYYSSKQALRTFQESYYGTHEQALTAWIYVLEEDSQYSALYPQYERLIDETLKRRMTKKFVAACPVDVYVYNAENQVIASVANGSVSSSDTIDAALLNDTKIFWFYDDSQYRIEYIGNDTGEMDVAITEFGEDKEATRTVNYYGVKLEAGATYHLDAPVSESAQTPAPYELKDSVKANVVSYDYDSVLTESSQHTIKVISGTLVHAGNSSTSAEAKKGEEITLNAYVPAGYKFVRWNVTLGTGVSLNATEQSATLIMPDQDVTVEAVLQLVDTAVVRADGERTATASTVNAKVCCAGSSAATVYCAFYNEAGKMLSVDIKSANRGENDLSFTTTSGGVVTAKLMVLDSQMIPQCDSKAVEVI